MPFREGKDLKLWPVGHIWPIASFYAICELRIIFAFLNHWEKKKEKYFVTHYKIIEISVSIHKVLEEHRHAHLFAYYLWLLSWKPQTLLYYLWLLPLGEFRMEIRKEALCALEN